jgi:hypothetical protein
VMFLVFIWSVIWQLVSSPRDLKKPCLFENTRAFRKVYGQFEKSMGYYESLWVLIINLFPL